MSAVTIEAKGLYTDTIEETGLYTDDIEETGIDTQQDAIDQFLRRAIPYAVSIATLICSEQALVCSTAMGSLPGCTACVAVALAHFRAQCHNQQDSIFFACLSIAVYSLEIDRPFEGLICALAVGYIGASKLSYPRLNSLLGMALTFYCFQAESFPISLLRGMSSAGLGWYAAKELGSRKRIAAVAAAAFFLIAFQKLYFVAALSGTFYVLRQRQSTLLKEFLRESIDILNPGGVLALPFGWCFLVLSVHRIAACRAILLIIGAESGYQFYLRKKAEKIIASPLYSWIMPNNSSAHLVEQRGGLGYVVSSIVDSYRSSTTISDEGSIPLAPGLGAPGSMNQAIAHLRECHLTLVARADGSMTPHFFRPNQIYTFPYETTFPFMNRLVNRLMSCLPVTVKGTISLHRSVDQEFSSFVYRWKWTGEERRHANWTDSFVPYAAISQWWPRSESLSKSMIWPDQTLADVGLSITNYWIDGHFGMWTSSWNALPVLRGLSFRPKRDVSRYDQEVVIDPNHFAVTLVSSGTRAADLGSWGGHAKVAIEYLDAGVHAIRYIHITVRDGVITRHFGRSDFRQYNVKSKTWSVPKALVKAAVAAPPEVQVYSRLGGGPFQGRGVTDNCYTYCVRFLDRLNIRVSSVAGMNIPNLLVPFQ